VLVNPTDPIRAEAITKTVQTAARTIGLQLNVLQASSEADFDAVFASLLQMRVDGLVIGGDPFFNSKSEQLGALTARHAVPSIFQFRKFTASGGLASYGTSLTESYRQMGVYAGRILKGEKPIDLPIVQATKFELVINLKTAKALGLDVSLQLQQRADEVIE
jgi:putative tryptophan/tyrosine transport system substrate-binding protein